MEHSFSLISTISASLGVALVFGFIAARLKLPVLVGYLLAGILLGPATPGFVADMELSTQLADIGVMLLMFGVGLHFSLDDLWQVRKIALPGAIVQIMVATAMGMAISHFWGWSISAGLIFGLSLSVASTVVLLKALENRGMLESVNGRIAIGWLVVEDLVMVLMLVLLPPLANWLGGNVPAVETPALPPTTIANNWPLLTALTITLGKVSVFIVFMLVIGRRIFPWLLWQVARTGSRELFTLCVIAAAVSIAYGSAELFGVSFALGAFFAGMAMRESDLSHRAAQETLPLRDAFSVLFFVSVGMLFDPRILLQQPLQVLEVVAVIMIGKSLAAFLLVIAFRYPLNTALTVSASLAQIGEFSFILAGLGVNLGLLPVEGQSLILAGALISITLNPLVFRINEPAQQWIRARSRLARMLEQPSDPLAELPQTIGHERLTGHVVLVGFGHVGKRIGMALADRGISFVVAEQQRELVSELRQKGIAAVSGNAADPVVLVQAHIHRANMLIIGTPDIFNARAMIETARTLKPDIEIIVRTLNEEQAALLKNEGVKVFIGEHELAQAMTKQVMDWFFTE